MPWRLFIALVTVGAVPVLLVSCFARVTGSHAPGYDAQFYLSAARAVRAGVFIYTVEPSYLYPPVLAVALTPLTWLPPSIALALWLGLVAGTSLALIRLLARVVPLPVACVGVLLFPAMYGSAWLGQVNALIACCYALALTTPAGRRSAWLAVGVCVKLVPGVALVAVLARRDKRDLQATLLLGLAVLAATLPVVGVDSWMIGIFKAATEAWDSSALISWTAIIARSFGTLAATLASIAFVAITLVRSTRVPLRLALAASMLAAFVVARVTWYEHSVMLLPALAVLWAYSPRGRWIAGTSWLAMALVGGIWLPLLATVCWIACCWPALLIDPAIATATRHIPPTASPEAARV